jgi:hypothetical protein
VHGLKLLVKVKGRVVVSIPSGRNDLDADGRDPLGRLYNQVSESDVRHLFEEEGFCLLGREEESDSLGRDGICWVTLCFERLGPSL